MEDIKELKKKLLSLYALKLFSKKAGVDILDKKDFLIFFKQVIDSVLQIKKQVFDAISKLEETYQLLFSKLGDKQNKALDSLTKEIEKRLSEVKDGYTPVKGLDYVDGKDGKDGRDGKDGSDGSPDTPDQIADKLNTLKEEINMEVIKGLKKELERIRVTGVGRSLGGVLNVGVRIETPEGVVDGSNAAFTAFKTPKWLVIDGVSYFENNGYTLSGKTLTVTVPPTGFIRSFY